MKFLILISMLFLGACGTMENLEDRQNIVPGAQGDIATKSDDNGNTQMNIRVKHLANPGKLAQGASNYVVWVLPNGGQTYQNVGTLRVDSDLEGAYNTTVPYRAFHVMITPERAPGVQTPTGPAVLEKNVSL